VVNDNQGHPLQVLALEGGLRRVFVPLPKFPQSLVRLVLTAEDRHFWGHPGVDPLALLRAAYQNFTHQEIVSGASTITMQVARLLHPHAHNMRGKLAEAWDALQLQARLGKAGVLELYLNLVPFGSNLEGFPAAAQGFFGKPVGALSPLEAAELALIPRSPQDYSPWEHPKRSLTRAKALVRAAFSRELSSREISTALDPARNSLWPFRAPHYVRWLMSLPEAAARDGRTALNTAIEPALQSYLEGLVARTVAQARTKRISNAAALFIRPETMTIAAWVGSADYFNTADLGQNDGVTISRQPGSTLKPFLYALALEHGFTAATILPDVPTDFGGSEVYTPANFNNQFNGPVRLRQALASSLNVPAVYTLQRLGVQKFADFLIHTGFQTLESQRHQLGLALALGDAHVRLFDLVQAYGIFSHGGRFAPLLPAPGIPSPLLSEAGQKRITPQAAELIRDILTRHPDRILAYGARGNDQVPLESALKTGTSNQFNNIWAVGFTPQLLGGVWMGNFRGQTIVGTADSGFPASIVSKTLEVFGSQKAFPPITDLERHRICTLSGMAATDDCPDTMDEWFVTGTAPGPCTWHLADGTVRFPQEFHAWLARYRYQERPRFLSSQLVIRKPLDGAVYNIDPSVPANHQKFVVEALGHGVALVQFDGRTMTTTPFPVRTFLPLVWGDHRVGVLSLETGKQAAVFVHIR